MIHKYVEQYTDREEAFKEIIRYQVGYLIKSNDDDIYKNWIPYVASMMVKLRDDLRRNLLIAEGPNGPIYYHKLQKRFL